MGFVTYHHDHIFSCRYLITPRFPLASWDDMRGTDMVDETSGRARAHLAEEGADSTESLFRWEGIGARVGLIASHRPHS